MRTLKSNFLLLAGIAIGFMGLLQTVFAAGGGGACTGEVHENQGPNQTWTFSYLACLGQCPLPQGATSVECIELLVGTYFDQQGHQHEQHACVCLSHYPDGGTYMQYDQVNGGFACDATEDVDLNTNTTTGKCMGACAQQTQDCNQGTITYYTVDHVLHRRWGCKCQ